MRPPTLALLLALLAALVLGAAAPGAHAETGRKPEHRSTYDVKRLDAHDYLFFGRVPTYRKGTLSVLRQRSGSPGYQPYRKVPIRGTGKFSTRLTGNAGDCFRMRIPKANGHRTTIENLGCIVPRR
jgi:hypothetical protein